jgi:hypothetical protein
MNDDHKIYIFELHKQIVGQFMQSDTTHRYFKNIHKNIYYSEKVYAIKAKRDA